MIPVKIWATTTTLIVSFYRRDILLPLWLIKTRRRLTFHRNAKSSPALCEDNWNRLCLPRHSQNVLLMTLTKSKENQTNTEPAIQNPYYWLELWLQGHETAVRTRSINWFRSKDEVSWIRSLTTTGTWWTAKGGKPKGEGSYSVWESMWKWKQKQGSVRWCCESTLTQTSGPNQSPEEEFCKKEFSLQFYFCKDVLIPERPHRLKRKRVLQHV